MPLDFPLYYAGVADEDMLDEFLVGRRELDHGQSSTMDVRRFLNVKYHQASVGKFKKVAAVSTIAFVLIIVMVLTFGSTPTKKIAIKTLPASSEPKEPGAEKHRHSFVLATNPDMPIDLALKCNTCALVSSSGMLLGSNAGSQIDSADCVFRFNSAPTLGYERDVGSKTTIRVVSVKGLKSLITYAWQKTLASFEDLDYMILLGPEELLCENCTLSNRYRKFAEYLHNTDLLRVRQETYQQIKQESRKLGIKYGRQDLPVSTRFYTMSLVQQVCPQIRVFGMELENPCQRSGTIPLFYWDPDSWRHQCLSREGRVQEQVLQRLKRLRQEGEIFNSWARQYHIEFFYPSQKVT